MVGVVGSVQSRLPKPVDESSTWRKNGREYGLHGGLLEQGVQQRNAAVLLGRTARVNLTEGWPVKPNDIRTRSLVTKAA
jgi:hypothetical protein